MKLRLNANTKYNIFARFQRPDFNFPLLLSPQVTRLGAFGSRKMVGSYIFILVCVCPGLVTQFKDQRALHPALRGAIRFAGRPCVRLME